MIYSMTGFSQSNLNYPNYSVSIEMKSLNSKSLDLNLKMPSMLYKHESKYKDLVQKILKRGKIDIYIKILFDNSLKQNSFVVNADEINKNIKEMKSKFSFLRKNEIFLLLSKKFESSPQVEQNIETIDLKGLEDSLTKTCNSLKEYRQKEGTSIENDFLEIKNSIQKYLEEIKIIEKERIPLKREQLLKKLDELKSELNEKRLYEEILYYTDKWDIAEEIQRLQAHLSFLEEILKDNNEEEKGKKIGFLAQEISREINTIGSKANQINIQKIVVEMKNHLEKLKEQSFNIL